ncbi:hypothetical protein [Streptomyces sp. SID3343]|uniref:hypothetical protein n=1 Tax=Streptomyces sp. SID3343 TaxID=2690260 RepID=UPI0013689333|nr:hypothetical protein [Streptomyces sp. SID3343]MYV97101.1 hypothetical protein [Streptomyces sp. SID3343]
MSVLLLAEVGVGLVGGLVVWLRYVRWAPPIPDGLRERWKLTRALGTADRASARVDPRRMSHREVVDSAAAHGFVVEGWSPGPAGTTTYRFVRTVAFPVPCRLHLVRMRSGR